MVRHRFKINNYIIQILSLLLALTVRLITGSSVVFYACNCTDSVFPSKSIYFILYIVRVLIAASIFSFTIFNCKGISKTKNIVFGLFITLIVVFEYRFLIGCESYLITIALHCLSVYLSYLILRSSFNIKSQIIILSLTLIVLQCVMILLILSLII